MSAHASPGAIALEAASPPGPPRWLVGLAGALSFLIGIAALVWPGPTLLVVGVLFGGYFVVWGVIHMIQGISAPDVSTGLRVLDILVSVLALLLGLFLIVRPGASVVTAAWTLGFWWALF